MIWTDRVVHDDELPDCRVPEGAEHTRWIGRYSYAGIRTRCFDNTPFSGTNRLFADCSARMVADNLDLPGNLGKV